VSSKAHRARGTQQELEESFDAFYRSTRRRLLLETVALTGDVSAAQSAVRDAYASAWHRWRTLSRLDDPLSRIRPRAWQVAKRPRTTHALRRPRRLPHDQRRVLRALARLSVSQRRVLVAVDVAGLDLSTADRQLGLGSDSAEATLERARHTLAVALRGEGSRTHRHAAEKDDALTPQRMVTVLEEMVEGVTLLQGSRLRRSDRRRRRTRIVAAAAAGSLLAVAAGTLVYEPEHPASAVHQDGPSASPKAATRKLPTGDDLLDAAQVRSLAPSRSWRTTDTTDNTGGDGLNSVCQQTRFADPRGYNALVRKFRTQGRGTPSAVQTVEVSRSTAASRRTFVTTVGWYAGCPAPRVQIVGAYRVHGVGDRAALLVLQRWGQPRTTISVGVARTGRLVTSAIATTPGSVAPSPRRLAMTLARAVSTLCSRTGASGCVDRPGWRAVPPPPSGEGRGLLAVADLPPVGGIKRPWAGTHPITPRRNAGATTCDEAGFASAGARQRRSRTYLVPQAKVPARFGLTETSAVFATKRTAAGFLADIRSHVASCEKRDLAAKLDSSRTWHAAGADLSRWGITLAVSEHEKVRMRVAFVRVGNRVAQLTFVPADHDDIAPGAFDAMLMRAGQRLREL
jgi:DNA-directed RNA polymerase specialized sigma24 family protein